MHFFHKPAAFKADAAQSDIWNRGAYLVESLGHCGACIHQGMRSARRETHAPIWPVVLLRAGSTVAHLVVTGPYSMD